MATIEEVHILLAETKANVDNIQSDISKEIKPRLISVEKSVTNRQLEITKLQEQSSIHSRIFRAVGLICGGILTTVVGYFALKFLNGGS